MKKDNFGTILMLLTLFFVLHEFVYGQITNEENAQTFIMLKDNKQKVIDLTEELKTECSQSITRRVGQNSVTIMFQPEMREQVETMADKLGNVLKEMQNILNPLSVDDVKFYILRRNEIPVNYKITEKWRGKKYYTHFTVIKDIKDSNSSDCINKTICANIFEVIPHELTHISVGNLIESKKNRWFDEGLAEFVANEVTRKLSHSDYEQKIESYAPEISLFRNEIRTNIWMWGEPNLIQLFTQDYKETKNELFKYGAAYQIIKQTITEAENNGIKEPLNLLLGKIKEHKEKKGKPVSSDEIIYIIQENLKINPKTLKLLDQQKQKDLINDAMNLLSQKEITIEKKNYALNILAGIDEIEIPEKWIIFLLNEVYRQKEPDEVLRELAATAVSRRIKQTGVDDTIRKYIADNKKLQDKSFKKIKNQLDELSVRPKIN